MPTLPLTLAARATLACVWEATAPKPGNVYRGADFEDVTYAEFLTSAVAMGPAFDRAAELGLGGTILAAIQAMHAAVRTNTYLGTILLLAPLAIAAPQPRRRIAEVLAATTIEDAEQAYAAIRLAAPGGLGKAAEGDVAESPRITLTAAMRLAAERDLVARQYANNFADVFRIADEIAVHLAAGAALADAIVTTFIDFLAAEPDTLIARKCGAAVAAQAQQFAQQVAAARPADPDSYAGALADFDFWLRADAHRRNPGATADLIAAALFTLLIEERVAWPVRFYG
jgi:triphosphoribosyl-dephospho-CoA synthase